MKGQADTFERKIEVCARAYKILTEQVDFNPHDMIFDPPNVLAVATGIEEHDNLCGGFYQGYRMDQKEFARCTRQWWREQPVVLLPWK